MLGLPHNDKKETTSPIFLCKGCQNLIFAHSIAFYIVSFYNSFKRREANLLVVKRKLPSKILVIKALLRRGILDTEQRKRLDELRWRAERGFEGEQRVDTFLADIQLSESNLILQGFESVNQHCFTHQMDKLIVTSRFILILEVKNISGIITYDMKTNQLI